MASGIRRFIRISKFNFRLVTRFLVDLPKGLRGYEARLNEARTKLSQLQADQHDTNRKLLYAHIGVTLTAWARMEEGLVTIFAVLLRENTRKAGLIMYSIINFNVWLSLIHDLFEMDELFSPYQKRWNKISERIREIKDKRDQLAHHSVRDLDGRPAALGSAFVVASKLDTRRKSQLQEPLDIEDVGELAETIWAITEDVVALAEAMGDALEASTRKPA